MDGWFLMETTFQREERAHAEEKKKERVSH